MEEKELSGLLTQHHQDGLISHLQGSAENRKSFLKASGQLDLELAFKLYAELSTEQAPESHSYHDYPGRIFKIPQTAEEINERQQAKQKGEAMLREGKVVVLIVAAGQGSRLGWPAPKGTFPISPVKGKSLFQLFSEKIIALRLKYGCELPLLLMTNSEDGGKVGDFFAQNHFFGLGPATVTFFDQAMLPAFTPRGQLVLKDSAHLYTSPDGHGGVLKALQKAGLLRDLSQKGISEIFYAQVDNPLVELADPVFLGYHATEGCDISTKVVRRRDCREKLGVFLGENGVPRVVEYSDIDEATSCAINPDGTLRHWAGSTAIHILSLSFLNRLMQDDFDLPYHRAVKKVAALGGTGKEEEVTVWKFEKFIFDIIPLADRTCCMEVVREEEFAPLKNKDGPDSAPEVKSRLSEYHRKWLSEASIETPDCANVEISPLYASAKEDFLNRVRTENGVLRKLNGCYLDESRQPRRRNLVDICDVFVDNTTFEEFIDYSEEAIAAKKNILVVTPNIDHIIRLQSDAFFRQIYAHADAVLADGMPLIWASRFLGTPLKEKISGSDIFPRLCERAAQKGYRVFFLGGRPESAEKAAENLRRKYPGLDVAGTYCPPAGFEKSGEENQKIIRIIRAVKPDILFVGLGSPKQEEWIYNYKDQYDVPVSIGIGGSFEFASGMVRRAPVWMQRSGLEFLWRLLMEPRRLWRRYLVQDPVFFWLLLKHKLALVRGVRG